MLVSDMTTAQLDYLVAKAEGWKLLAPNHDFYEHTKDSRPLMYALDWMPTRKREQGGAIIEREGIQTRVLWISGGKPHAWEAKSLCGSCLQFGNSLLEAAMRCFVAARFGEEIELPAHVAA